MTDSGVAPVIFSAYRQGFSEIAGRTCSKIVDINNARMLSSYNEDLLKNPGMIIYSGIITLSRKGTHNTITIRKSAFSTKGDSAAGIGVSSFPTRKIEKNPSISLIILI
jgi:hypothetical protein